MVGVEISGGAAELTAYGHGLERVGLGAQTIGEHSQLLAQTGGAGRLSVGLGEHGNVGPFVGLCLEVGNETLEFGQIDFEHRLAYRHGHGGVVDVLGCEAEMNELLAELEPEGVEFLLQVTDSISLTFAASASVKLR